jgi:hypothetical protein
VQTGHEQWNLVYSISRLFSRLFPRLVPGLFSRLVPRSICFRSGWSFSSDWFRRRSLVNLEQSYKINVHRRWLFSSNWTVNDSYTQWTDQ